MIFFQHFDLDREKDIRVDLYMDGSRMDYVIRTPNHHSGNLITNLARLCGLETSLDGQGLRVIRGEVPGYFDGNNRRVYILRLGNTKVANIYPDGTVEVKASVPAISKTLMSQTKDYRLGVEKTIVKTYIRSECKFRTDLHTHMNGNLPPDVLMALGIVHQIRYPYYYIKKLNLSCTPDQIRQLEARRVQVEKELGDIPLTGRYRERRIDDFTFINFADLILGNPQGAQKNLETIRNSLTVPKDGQAVFANLEKVYLYRYVFTRGKPAGDRLSGINPEGIPDRDVRSLALRMIRDRENPLYRRNTLFQDLLVWIGREYQKHGIEYAEITDTSLLNRTVFPARLREIHEVMPNVTRETGVLLRFLAGIRRTPLTIVRDSVTPNDYLSDNLRCLRAIAGDPYVAGSDIIGEEINDILELRSVIRELVRIAGEHPGFVIRIHAGENDGLRDNVANSIRCVSEALEPGQPFPPLRIGHGLYTCDLRSPRGKKLLEDMLRCHVTLEFQITSNVRLNNLSHLDRHPLRQYLRAGISCVQGTDGGALYGTNSIDEELSLEKLLDLTTEELVRMREAEDEILAFSRRAFQERQSAFLDACPAGDTELYYRRLLEQAEQAPGALWENRDRMDAESLLKDQIGPVPEGLFPVIVSGGSFNSYLRRTVMHDADRELLDRMCEKCDPDKVVFVVGHSLTGQEGYLVRRARDRFRILAIVPNRLTRTELSRLKRAGIRVLISIESSGMGLYKSFAYEIFRHQPSALLVFDGNSAALNLVQEARNGKERCRILVNTHSRGLAIKAQTLKGYVYPLSDAEDVLRDLGLLLPVTS